MHNRPWVTLSPPIGLKRHAEERYLCLTQCCFVRAKKRRSGYVCGFGGTGSMRSVSSSLLCRRTPLGAFTGVILPRRRQPWNATINRERCLHPALQRGCPQELKGADGTGTDPLVRPGKCAYVTVSWTSSEQDQCAGGPPSLQPTVTFRKHRRPSNLASNYQGAKTARGNQTRSGQPVQALQVDLKKSPSRARLYRKVKLTQRTNRYPLSERSNVQLTLHDVKNGRRPSSSERGPASGPGHPPAPGCRRQCGRKAD